MTNLKVKPQGTSGLIHQVTPRSAGWSYVGFELHRLAVDERLRQDTQDREVCLVLVSGKATIKVQHGSGGEQDFGTIGERVSPFDGEPAAIYVPGNASYTVDARSDLELAICSAPAGGSLEPRLIAPGTHPQMVRGKGANTRYVTNIMPEDDGAAHSLLVVEVITPGGHTSSYPPHKHDQDALPAESYLEETYYHRFNPSQGFGFQRVYTDDRSLDEALAIENGDVVLVPRGYHPVATVHGYDNYYLNVMAGPQRVWKFHNAPEHEWLFTGV